MNTRLVKQQEFCMSFGSGVTLSHHYSETDCHPWGATCPPAFFDGARLRRKGEGSQKNANYFWDANVMLILVPQVWLFQGGSETTSKQSTIEGYSPRNSGEARGCGTFLVWTSSKMANVFSSLVSGCQHVSAVFGGLGKQ